MGTGEVQVPSRRGLKGRLPKPRTVS